jgi:GT2 family glycosyltransferase
MNLPWKEKITVSIVSHGHGAMVTELIRQLLECPEIGQIVVTLNIPEPLSLPPDSRVHNVRPKGFGSNHNAAFGYCLSPYFLVLNPDVVLKLNPFPALLEALQLDRAGLVSPKATGVDGTMQDCWRHFPTLRGLIIKLLGTDDGSYKNTSYASTGSAFPVDWVSGLCMLFPSTIFTRLNGFDESYFLYYEDVDICVRIWRSGYRVMACPSACLIHDGQRASRRNREHAKWHLMSMLKYFMKYWFRLPRKSQSRKLQA